MRSMILQPKKSVKYIIHGFYLRIKSKVFLLISTIASRKRIRHVTTICMVACC